MFIPPDNKIKIWSAYDNDNLPYNDNHHYDAASASASTADDLREMPGIMDSELSTDVLFSSSGF